MSTIFLYIDSAAFIPSIRVSAVHSILHVENMRCWHVNLRCCTVFKICI